MGNAAVEAAGSEEERFAPGAGRWFGWATVGLSTAFAALEVTADRTLDRKAIYLVVSISLVCWVVLIRPVVSLHADGVLLRNMVRNTFVPWSKIERCRALQTLQVVTEDAHYHGLGVSRSARSMVRRTYGRTSMTFRRPAMLTPGFGGSSGASPSGEAAPPASPAAHTDIAYQDYVEMRIEGRARDAKPDDLQPVVAWVWPSVAALVAAAALLVLLLV